MCPAPKETSPSSWPTNCGPLTEPDLLEYLTLYVLEQPFAQQQLTPLLGGRATHPPDMSDFVRKNEIRRCAISHPTATSAKHVLAEARSVNPESDSAEQLILPQRCPDMSGFVRENKIRRRAISHSTATPAKHVLAEAGRGYPVPRPKWQLLAVNGRKIKNYRLSTASSPGMSPKNSSYKTVR